MDFLTDGLKCKCVLAFILTFKRNGIFTWRDSTCKFLGTLLATLEASRWPGLCQFDHFQWESDSMRRGRLVKASFQGSLKKQLSSLAVLLLLCILNHTDRSFPGFYHLIKRSHLSPEQSLSGQHTLPLLSWSCSPTVHT